MPRRLHVHGETSVYIYIYIHVTTSSRAWGNFRIYIYPCHDVFTCMGKLPYIYIYISMSRRLHVHGETSVYIYISMSRRLHVHGETSIYIYIRKFPHARGDVVAWKRFYMCVFVSASSNLTGT